MADDAPAPRPGADARTWLGEPSRRTRFSYAIVRGLIRVVATLFGRVRIVGQEHVPTTGAFIVAPVHRSNVDFALTSLLTPTPMRYMGKDAIWKSKPLGRFVSMLGAFPVRRGAADRESLRVCREVVDGGSPLVMFPEGTRNRGPEVAELFDGTAYLAGRCGVPVIPVGIGGSEAMMPRGARFLRFSRLVLVVGAPLAPPERSATGQVRRSAVKAMSAELHQELQLLFDEAQSRAGRSNR